MHEIKCPNCSKTFNLDEAGYVDILNQVRNDAFNKALQIRQWRQNSQSWRNKLR